MPKIDGAQHEITVAAWLKRPGDQIRAGEVIAEVLTDKVNVEIESPATGVLDAILVEEGQIVAEGDTLGRVIVES